MTQVSHKGVSLGPETISLSEHSSSSFESVIPSSTLDYINSQLVAHGYIPPPGLNLDGVSNAEIERVAKCLLSMMSQRVEDMSRTEELTTKLRTLTYDHERLRSLHKVTTETAANAERDMNLHKSRLAAATRALQVSESAHKQITAELQRTRTTLQGVRASHQSEMKKKERDVERMSEKWSKIADAQAKHMAMPSGMRLSNLAVTTGSEIVGKGKGFLEIALDEAEKSRIQLGEENSTLRRLILSTVNEAQVILYQARPQTLEKSDEPTPYTYTTLFPLHPPGNANEKLSILLNNLRERLVTLTHIPSPSPPPSTVNQPSSEPELERLRGIIDALRNELAQSRKQSATQAEETRAMFDKFAEDHRIATREIGELSVELMTAPLCDAEKKRLDDIQKGLDQERQKFTEAAIQLGKERAKIEAERNQLLDEKRSWQVEMMLAELPPTPQPIVSPHRAVAAHRSPRKSPKKSPAKVCVGKAGPSMRKRTTRVSKRPTLTSPSKVIPSYETEYLPPIQALGLDNTNIPPPATSLLPTSFSLPPPSPHASLPSHPVLLTSTSPPESQQIFQESTTPPSSSSPSIQGVSTSTDPATPAAPHRLFPVAKPFAQRMIHAYSPVKPSPLSRILMLGNSPNSPENPNWGSEDVSSFLEPIVEGNEHIAGFEEPVVLGSASFPPTTTSVQMSLAAELGVSESPPESPLQEKKLEPNRTVPGGRVFQPDPKRIAAKGKNKAQIRSAVNTINVRVKTSAGTEKENSSQKTKARTVSAPSKISPPEIPGEAKKIAKPPSKSLSSVTTSHQRPAAKLPPPSKGGPRRVLVDSEEAPIISKGWKG